MGTGIGPLPQAPLCARLQDPVPHLGHSPPRPSGKPGFRPQYSGLRACPTAPRASLPAPSSRPGPWGWPAAGGRGSAPSRPGTHPASPPPCPAPGPAASPLRARCLPGGGDGCRPGVSSIPVSDTGGRAADGLRRLLPPWGGGPAQRPPGRAPTPSITGGGVTPGTTRPAPSHPRCGRNPQTADPGSVWL